VYAALAHIANILVGMSPCLSDSDACDAFCCTRVTKGLRQEKGGTLISKRDPALPQQGIGQYM
jgi:hypothetical protein